MSRPGRTAWPTYRVDMDTDKRDRLDQALHHYYAKRRHLDKVWPIDLTPDEMTDDRWKALEETHQAAMELTAAREYAAD